MILLTKNLFDIFKLLLIGKKPDSFSKLSRNSQSRPNSNSNVLIEEQKFLINKDNKDYKELHDSGVNLINSSSFDYRKKLSEQNKTDNIRLLNFASKSKSLQKSSNNSVKKKDTVTLFNDEKYKSSSIKKEYIEDNHEMSSKMFKVFRKSLDDSAANNLKMKQSMFDAVKKKNT